MFIYTQNYTKSLDLVCLQAETQNQTQYLEHLFKGSHQLVQLHSL